MLRKALAQQQQDKSELNNKLLDVQAQNARARRQSAAMKMQIADLQGSQRDITGQLHLVVLAGAVFLGLSCLGLSRAKRSSDCSSTSAAEPLLKERYTKCFSNVSCTSATSDTA